MLAAPLTEAEAEEAIEIMERMVAGYWISEKDSARQWELTCREWGIPPLRTRPFPFVPAEPVQLRLC